MTRIVHCAHHGQDGEGLSRPPLPGELGQKIYDNICAKAWKEWMEYQTMLINEKRLSPINPEHRAYLESQCEAFLFGDGKLDPVAGYVPPEKGDS